jgi:hypothetical protein
LLLRQVDYIDISLVDNQASSHSDEHIVLQLLEDLIEEVKLEGHLASLAISQYEIRIVTVGTDIDNLIRSDTYQFGTGRYSEPFHVLTGYYSANIRIFIESYVDCTSFLTLFTDKRPK